jgi:hypothetical protein
VALAAGVVLSPPPPTPGVISALDREAGPADTLPEGIQPFSREGYTARLLATSDGIRYFVSQNRDAVRTCLTMYPDNYLWTLPLRAVCSFSSSNSVSRNLFASKP